MTPTSPKLVPLVLVCDDDADSRAIIGMAVRSLGYEVVEAEDGQVAIEKCREKLPDVAVMDIMMPRVTGLEFVSWLRSEKFERYVPVLLLTALTEIEDRVRGLDHGADEYVTKPFNIRELQARIQALFRIKQLTEQLYDKNKRLEEVNEELSRMQAVLVQKEREIVAIQLAGAAAHTLGQPLSAILLHCYLIEKLFSNDEQQGQKNLSMAEQVFKAVKAIRKECESAKGVLSKLEMVDSTKTQDYLSGMKILDLD